jgi:hypothetical protein
LRDNVISLYFAVPFLIGHSLDLLQMLHLGAVAYDTRQLSLCSGFMPVILELRSKSAYALSFRNGFTRRLGLRFTRIIRVDIHKNLVNRFIMYET